MGVGRRLCRAVAADGAVAVDVPVTFLSGTRVTSLSVIYTPQPLEEVVRHRGKAGRAP